MHWNWLHVLQWPLIAASNKKKNISIKLSAASRESFEEELKPTVFGMLAVDFGVETCKSDGIFMLSMDSSGLSCFRSGLGTTGRSPDDFVFVDVSFDPWLLDFSTLFVFAGGFLFASCSFDTVTRSMLSLAGRFGSLNLALPDFRNWDRMSPALIQPCGHNTTILFVI